MWRARELSMLTLHWEHMSWSNLDYFFFLTSEKQDNMLQLREEPEVFQSNILQEMLLGCIGNKIIDQ